jgi:hypothetical protein
MNAITPYLTILAGLIILCTGRKIVWLAAGLAIFLFIYRAVQNYVEPGLVGMLIAGVLSFLLAGLALRFIQGSGMLIGALAGAVGLPVMLGMFGLHWSWWILAIIGAVIGMIVVAMAFDWGLIVMTCWVGANTVAGEAQPLFHTGAAVASLLFIGLFVLGIVVQGRQATRG